MVTELVAIPESTHNVLKRLTGQSRPDVALSLVSKELIRFRLEATQARITAFEKKYGMAFSKFEQAWQSGKIEDPHFYPVEQDYMQWETALADLKLPQEILQ